MKKFDLSPERCLQPADMEGDHTVAAGAIGPLMSGSERRLVLGSSRPQCMFASLSETIPQCEKTATRKWGGLWFCDEHGSRNSNSENSEISAR